MNANDLSIKIGDRVRFVSNGFCYPYMDDCGTVRSLYGDPEILVQFNTLPTGCQNPSDGLCKVDRKHITPVVPAESERAA